MASATEAELGELFAKFQKAISMRTSLAKMGHPHPPTQVVTDNTESNSIVNVTEKQKGPEK